MDQKPENLRVVSAVADKKQVILYLEDGNTLVIKQGDHRLGDLMDVIIPITTRGEIAVVSLSDFSVYAAFEQKTQGLTKFFKMAKTKVSGWFGGKTNTHETHIPEEGKQAILRAIAGETMTEEDVAQYGQPIDPSDEVGPDEVVVAVVTTPATETHPETKKVIPGVQSIKPLIDHAVKTNSPEAVQAFLSRCASFIDNRQHSVDDLMRFLEKGDLPLTEDGAIIAYKMLRSKHGSPGVFVDCHSGRIEQRVGSYVCVNENLVDLNRRNECSNGLHIARRGYLGSFGGDVCVLCKIDPEDVMVVPHNDPNKVRVKGYHILGVMSQEAMAELKKNKPMTGDEEALTMVYNAIKGNHIDRIERVQVNGQMGTNVVVTKLKHDKTKGQQGFDHTGADLSKAAALDDETNSVGAVDPREINKRVSEEHQKLSEDKAACSECNVEFLKGDLTDGVCETCLEAMTAPYEADEVSQDDLEAAATFHDTLVAKPTDPAPIQGDKKPTKAKPTPKAKVGTKEKKAKAPAKAKPAKTTPPVKATKAQQARAIFETGDMEALRAFKKQAKKGWEVLGFSSSEVEKILK